MQEQPKHVSRIESEPSKVLLIKVIAGVVLLLWSFSEFFNNELSGTAIWKDPTFSIFVAFGNLILLFWLWGACSFIWRRFDIDFRALLQLEGTDMHNSHSPELIVVRTALDHSLVYLATFICFNRAIRGKFVEDTSAQYARYLPILMMLYLVYSSIVPWTTKFPWWYMLYHVLAAPLYPVVFRDGFIGDLLTSLVRVFIQLAISVGYLYGCLHNWATGSTKFISFKWENDFIFGSMIVPLLTLLPLWLRLVQCLRRSVESGNRWPHMGNAAKYTSAIIVISLGTFLPSLRENTLWIMGFVFATLFQYCWDLTMDWGIVVWSHSALAGPLKIGVWAIRRDLLLGPASIYLSIAVINLLLRFAWTLTLLPATDFESSILSVIMEHLGSVVAATEVFRRMLWAILRLEFEQIEVIGSPERTHDTDFTSKSLSKMDFGSSDITSNGSIGHVLLPSFDSIEALLPSSFLIMLRDTFDLDIASSKNSKRLVESMLFSCCVLSIMILSYCFREINIER